MLTSHDTKTVMWFEVGLLRVDARRLRPVTTLRNVDIGNTCHIFNNNNNNNKMVHMSQCGM